MASKMKAAKCRRMAAVIDNLSGINERNLMEMTDGYDAISPYQGNYWSNVDNMTLKEAKA